MCALIGIASASRDPHWRAAFDVDQSLRAVLSASLTLLAVYAVFVWYLLFRHAPRPVRTA